MSCAARFSHSSLLLGPLPLKLGGSMLTGAPVREEVDASAAGVEAGGATGPGAVVLEVRRGRVARPLVLVDMVGKGG